MDNYKPVINNLVQSYLLQQYGTMLGLLGKNFTEAQSSSIVELLKQSDVQSTLTNIVYEELLKDEDFVKKEKTLIWLHNLSQTLNNVVNKISEMAEDDKVIKETAQFAVEIISYLDKADN